MKEGLMSKFFGQLEIVLMLRTLLLVAYIFSLSWLIHNYQDIGNYANISPSFIGIYKNANDLAKALFISLFFIEFLFEINRFRMALKGLCLL